jgi:transcriptional regulator with XRE-family HTH domain
VIETIPEPAGELEASIGARFRKVRKGRKVSLRTLADRLQVSINTVRWHEAGARMMRVDDVAKAAEIIGVSLSHILRHHIKKEDE